MNMVFDFLLILLLTKIHHFKIRDNCERNVNIFLRAKETLRKRNLTLK